MRTARVARFLVAGGIAAIANFLSRIAFSTFMAYVPAIVLAYCVGMATAFTLNRRFVFDDANNRLGQQIFWFVTINLLAVAQTVALSLLFARLIFPCLGMTYYPDSIAHAIGIVVPVLTSYLGHKHLSFRATTKGAPSEQERN